MNTPHLLICVEKPKEPDERKNVEWGRWFGFLEEYEKSKWPSEGFSRPIENLWLIDVTRQLLAATRFLALLSRLNMAHNVFYLQDAPMPCS